MRAIRRIAVVGGGPSGVAAAKGILAELNDAEIDIFEQQASFGGVWNYSNDSNGMIDVPQTNPHQPLDAPIWQDVGEEAHDCARAGIKATFASPMYENLESNLPHVLMKFSDSQSLENNQLFPTREAITAYLEEYGKDIQQHVHFQTQVVNVEQKCQGNQRGWVVQTRNLHHPETTSKGDYDAVLVANGHYTVPSLPAVKGIREWNKVNQGIISHSKFYRRPQPFTNKKTIIVGNSASAIDIASQIIAVSKHPLLNSTRSDSALLSGMDYCTVVPEITEFLPSNHGRAAVRFADGSSESDVDAILFCTGYFYSFPFLSSLSPGVVSSGDRVQHLYRHLFYIPDPTLVFVGLPYKIIPFRTVEGQVAVVSRVWSHRLDLPSRTIMHSWEEARIAECGTGKSFHTLSPVADIEYYNEMLAWASNARWQAGDKLPPRWTEKDKWLRKQCPVMKKIFADRGEERYKVRTLEDLGYDYEAWHKSNDNSEVDPGR